MRPVQEVVPGIHHWEARHPKIKLQVSSYYVEPAATLLDPIMPEDGDLDWFSHRERRPERIVLTNRHHYRHSDEFRAALGGLPVFASRQGMHEFESGPDVEPFDFGEEVAPGITAIEVGGICPDETALRIDIAGGTIAFADGVIRPPGGGPLMFVPDQLMGEPERDKEALRRALSQIVDEEEFENLLLAHRKPVVGDGRRALLDFVKE